MYKISVPIMNANAARAGREELAKMLYEINAERVFLALGSYQVDENERRKEFEALKDNCRYFRELGFEVGAWIWTFQLHGVNDYAHITSPDGQVSEAQICPSDASFRLFAGQYLKEIAKCGVDIIMYDDDFRYGFLDKGIMGCTCKNHLAYMSEILNEKINEDGLAEKLLKGGRNKYRSAWLKANGHFMRLFAKEMRQRLDEVDPTIRFGACSCMSLWDFDGVSSVEICHILAGKTRPFLRLIGAPYWAVHCSWGNRLQDVVELERMERSWCENYDIEIYIEKKKNPSELFTIISV